VSRVVAKLERSVAQLFHVNGTVAIYVALILALLLLSGP